MSLVFLHTADWQLGKPFASVRDDAKRHRLQQERLHAVHRLAELANSSAAEFILIAGDMWHLAEAQTLRTVPANNTDKAETLRSMDKVEALQRETGARLIRQHVPIDVDTLPKFPAPLE